ncbi:MAG TPA: hypothetical protein VK590_00005, partial [Saprospiraceae bacterium]|nr:hypothetical protein [Saprospiraceae bacterium]
MDREAQIEQIEDYLTGRLSPSEKTAFEIRISNEPELAEEVSLHRLFLGGMDRLSETNLKENIKAWIVPVNPIEDNHVNNSKKSSRNNRYYLIGIIAIVLTSLVCYMVFKKIDRNKEVALQIKEQKIDSLNQVLKMNYRAAFEQQQNSSASSKLDSLNQEIEELEKELNTLKVNENLKANTKSGSRPIASLEKQYNQPTDWPSGYRSIDEKKDQKSTEISKAIQSFKDAKLT